jgi:hypothetical protein
VTAESVVIGRGGLDGLGSIPGNDVGCFCVQHCSRAHPIDSVLRGVEEHEVGHSFPFGAEWSFTSKSLFV